MIAYDRRSRKGYLKRIRLFVPMALILLLLLTSCSSQPKQVKITEGNCNVLVGLKNSNGTIICALDSQGWAGCTESLRPNVKYQLVFKC